MLSFDDGLEVVGRTGLEGKIKRSDGEDPCQYVLAAAVLDTNSGTKLTPRLLLIPG